ncbi:MAG: hypothetical protein AB1757_02390 [Acidobacteriota bacterium]
MSSQDALQRARQFISAQNGVIAPLNISEEELNPTGQDDLSFQAYPLESMESCYRVNFNYPEDSTCSEFSFFEDGKQRTVQIGFIPTIIGNNQVLLPVHFFVVASVILRRENHELKVWNRPEIEQGIFVERSLVPDQQRLQEFERMGLNVVGIPAQGGDYYDLKRRALQEAKKRRLEIEDRLIAVWRLSDEAQNSFLVVDGTLMNFRNEENVEKCVGVSKSFGSRYFEVSDHNRIMRMTEFERSWTFRFHSPENEADDLRQGRRERISWYLRLRDKQNADPEFGLVRVEISQRHAERASEYAERFSRSLLSDRLPTSYPAPRWDKHLYPVCACENYLASIMPSISTINAAMKG